MARIHLFEFEDQAWMPSFLRDYMTDFLSFLSNHLDVFKPIVPIISRALESSSERTIVDLGSGAGGGWMKLSTHLHNNHPGVRIHLSDFYPNRAAMNRVAQVAPNVSFIEHPIDARKVPAETRGLRTLFLAFHHFKPKDAALILQNAVDANQPICVFEGQNRSLPSIVGMVFSPIVFLATTPFIKPFEFKRLIFAYLIPVLPVLVLWDGVVSCLRTYSVRELKALIQGLEGNERFEWEVNGMKSGPGKILYLMGIPKSESR